MKEPGYWYTDPESDAVSSLSAAADFLERSDCDLSYWKWSVVALHSAVQGLLTLSLRQGNNLLVQKPGRARQMLAALEDGTRAPTPFMDNFMGLYVKALDPSNFQGGHAPIPPDPSLKAAMEAFDHWRHEFLHFNSKGWAIELQLLASRCHSAVAVAAQVLESGVILWRSEGLQAESHVQVERARRALGA